MLPTLYTPAEAATLSRRHVVTIRRDLIDGVLHGTQRTPGGRWTISETCLTAYVAGARCSHP